MASGVRGVFVTVALLNLFNVIICSSDFVPVVLWQTSSSLGNDLPSVSALNKLSRSEFEEDLTGKLNRRGPVLFFLQDDLSLEDFTLWGDVYGSGHQKNSFANIQRLLDSNPSTLFPAVESPEDSISVVADGRTVVEANGDEVSSLSAEDLDNSLLIYHLPSTGAAEDRQQALRKNDQIIGDAVKKVSAKSPSYTAVYTARHSSWVSTDEERVRSSRHALAVADPSNNGTFFGQDGCYALFFDAVSFDRYTKTGDQTKYTVKSSDLPDLTLFTVEANCTNINSTSGTVGFKLIYTNPADTNVTKMEVTMDFSLAIANDWILKAMSISYTVPPPEGTSHENNLDVDTNFWAPMYFSYHCGQQSFMYDTYSYHQDVTEKGGVTFTNLQVQPFRFKKAAVFGDPFDCVGFFTIGIWMTIFVSAILILVLGFGIHMTISIETMDRFDDPKGKTITVNASD